MAGPASGVPRSGKLRLHDTKTDADARATVGGRVMLRSPQAVIQFLAAQKVPGRAVAGRASPSKLAIDRRCPAAGPVRASAAHLRCTLSVRLLPHDAGLRLEVAAGYLYERLDGGPHWLIAPIHKLPEVAPVNGTVSLSYSTPFGGSYTFTSRLENSYAGSRYSIYFSDPYEFTGTYQQMPAYDLINFRLGVKLRDIWSATSFVSNLTNKHAQLESVFMENEPQPSCT